MKITIESHRGKLRLRWICPQTGNRRNLALGVDDSITGRAYAATTKDRIEVDVKYGYYNLTFLKYKPRIIGKNPTEITAADLFEKFTQHQFKRESLAQ